MKYNELTLTRQKKSTRKGRGIEYRLLKPGSPR